MAISDSLALDSSAMDETGFARTWAALRAGVEEGVAPGFVAGLWDARDPERIRVAAVGQRRVFPRELPVLPMLPETVFDLASLTKIMCTATLAAALVERGWIEWRTPLAAILPAARAPGVTLAHLLAHTAGYVAWQPLWERLRDRFAPRPLWRVAVGERQRAMRELVLAIEPGVQPGEQAVYSDISFLLLGFALEEVTGMPLNEAVRRFVWSPMGLREAFFRPVTSPPESARIESVAATEADTWRGGVLQGQVHDDNCWAMGGYAGHAGAFGTVRDVLQFARALHPRKGAPGFLGPSVLRAAWGRVAPPLGPIGCSRTLGWDTPSGDEPSASRCFSARSVGHLGFTGTSLWIDPEAGVAAALLSNRVHPTRDNPHMKAFRPRFHAALRMDLGC